MRNILLTLTTTLLFFCACKKPKTPTQPDNPYGLPNATQTGADVFACRVNGQNWVSSKSIYSMNAGYRNDTLFAFGTIGDNNYFEKLGFEINGNSQPNMTYQVGPRTCSFRLSTNKSCLGYLGSNVLNLQGVNGLVRLTQNDTNKKIISGAFECIIPIPNCDTLRITDGRFDLRYF